MKKAILTAAALLTLNLPAGFAAPINDLTQGQTALGIDSDTFYVEHKLSRDFTLGYQNIDRDNVGSMEDLYGQIKLSPNLNGIIGSRSFASDSNLYLGMSVAGAISSEADGYASLIAGNQFKELQVGTNIKLSHNTDLNLNYHSYMPDAGSNKTGVGIGATIKF